MCDVQCTICNMIWYALHTLHSTLQHILPNVCNVLNVTVHILRTIKCKYFACLLSHLNSMVLHCATPSADNASTMFMQGRRYCKHLRYCWCWFGHIWPSIVVLLILTLLLTPALWYWGYSVGCHWRMLDDDCKTGHNGQPCLAHLERFEHLLSFSFGCKWFCTQTILIKLENVSKQSCHQLLLLLLILFSWVWSRYLQILALVQSDIW